MNAWNRMSITDKSIVIFFAVNTLAILTLLKFVILGK
jgi:hypothetical protein